MNNMKSFSRKFKEFFLPLLDFRAILSLAGGGFLSVNVINFLNANIIPVDLGVYSARWAAVSPPVLFLSYVSLGLFLISPAFIRKNSKEVRIFLFVLGLLTFFTSVSFSMVVVQGEISGLFTTLLWGFLSAFVWINIITLEAMYEFLKNPDPDEPGNGFSFALFAAVVIFGYMIMWGIIMGILAVLANTAYRLGIFLLLQGGV